MASGGPKPPNLTRYTSETYISKLFKKDPNWLRESQEQDEYEMSSPRYEKRVFKGYYASRGPYAA